MIEKYVWMQDFDVFTSGGGAQLTDRAHLTEGFRRWHDLHLITGKGNHVDYVFLENALVIASNPNFATREFFEDIHEHGIPFVYFFHDYWPLCKWRLYFPGTEKCARECPNLPWLNILDKAKLLIFMSPVHRKAMVETFPQLRDVPYTLSPSPVSSRMFFDMELERKGVIGIESLNSFKGRTAFILWAEEHPEVPVTAIGGNDMPHKALPPNIKYIDYVPQHQLNELLNKHEALLHLPVSPSPFDRTCAEAIFAGCKIIGNENVGALSYDWFTDAYNVKCHCDASPGQLWDVLEKIAEGCSK